MKNKNIKALMLGLMAFVAPMVSAKIVTLDELYEQSSVIERVATIQQLEVAINPSEPGVLAGQVLLPADSDSVSKLDLKILSEAGEEFWSQSIVDPVAADFNFSHTIPTSFPKTDLNFVAQVWHEGSLFAAGQVSYENVGSKKSIPLLLSDISAEIQDSLLKVILSGKSLQKNEGISAEVKVYEAGSNKVLIERVSKPRAVSEGGNPAFELEFEKPKKAGVYTVIGSLLNGSKKSITGSVESTFVVDGTFATLKKINTDPQKFLTAGESVTIFSAGKVNKNLAEVEIEIEARSVQGGLLDTETLTVPVNRFKEFEFSHTFSVKEETEGLTGTVKVLSKNEVVLEKKFESLVFPKFADSGVTTAPEKNTNTQTETKNTQNKSQKFLMTGLGVAILLILIFVLIMVFKKKKPNSSNTLSMFGLLLAIGIFGQTFAAANSACDPDVAIISGVNSHCQFFDNEVYTSRVGAGNFGEIPFSVTTIAGGVGLLEIGETYDLSIMVCDDVDPLCNTTVSVVSAGNFIAARSKSFNTEVAASIFAVADGSEELIRVRGFRLTKAPEVLLFDFDTPYELTIDNRAPELTFVRKNQTAGAGDAILNINPLEATAQNPVNFYNDEADASVKNNFTKDAVRVEITCDDTGAGCVENNYEIEVTGNFCSDETICNNTLGARRIEVCDKVGNCTDGGDGSQIIIKNYDAAGPELETSQLGELAINPGNLGTRKAFESFIFKLKKTIDIDSASVTVDGNACGVGVTDGIVSVSSPDATCKEAIKACAASATLRGTTAHNSVACDNVGNCPTGFAKVNCSTGDADTTGNCCAAPTGTEQTCNTQFDYCFPITLN